MKKIIIIIIVFCFSLLSCNNNTVKGIVIGNTLLAHRTIYENNKLKTLIEKSLNKDSKSIVEIKNMPCGGGSGCYDLGDIITQIIFKLGEEEFIVIYNKMTEKDKKGFKEFIEVGLQYGDNDYNGKIGNLRIDKVFPKLNKIVK